MYKFKEVVRQHGGYLVRVFQAIDGFRSCYGEWPTKLHLDAVAYEGLCSHLTKLGIELLNMKIAIEIDDNGPSSIYASDESGRTLVYGWVYRKPDIDAFQWLGIDQHK